MNVAMSLRSRLALLFGALALAVSVVVSLLAFQSTRNELAGSTDDFLVNRASEVVTGLRASPQGRREQGNDRNTLSFDPDSIVQSIDRLGDVTGSSGGELPVSDGTRKLLEASPGGSKKPLGRFEDVTIDGESYRMYVQALPSGGAVQVARSTVENGDVLGDLATRFVLIGLVASIAAAIVGWLATRQTTKPLRRLANVAGVVADTRDFSVRVPVERSDEIGALAGRFQQMLDALATSREQQHRLVHDAGHELRTPLTSLRANVELLQRARTLPEQDQVEVLDAIKSELGELGTLFEELMELATDTHDDDVPMGPCDLVDVVRRTVDRWQRRSNRVIEVDASSAVIDGNEAMLERAVTNLLGNADKFSPADGSIEVVAHGGSVLVRDHGPGIPEVDRDRVFDRFYRSDSTRAMPGSGLGLAIVAQIVERHAGTVSVGSAPTGGAEIGFRLPLIP